MLVIHNNGSALGLVRQADHAAMAADLARAWRRPEVIPPSVWARLIESVRIHDDGWSGADDFPALNAQGQPYDFLTIPTAQHVNVFRKSIELAERKDFYAALLVAQHTRVLYTRHIAESDPADQKQAQLFINHATARIDGYINKLWASGGDDRAAVDPSLLMLAVRLVTAFDFMSLAILGVTPWPEKFDKLRFDRDERSLSWKKAGDGKVTMDPWPFAGDEVVASVNCYHLDRRRFADPGHLAGIMRKHQPTLSRYVLAKNAE